MHRTASVRSKVAALLAVLAFAMALTTTDAGAAPIDRIRISRSAGVGVAEIEFGCAMRYLGHTPSEGGIELEIRLAIGWDCQHALRTTLNSLHRPAGRQLASIAEIEFDADARDRATLTLRFETPVAFGVTQTANAYMVTVEVDTARAMPPARPPPAAESNAPAPAPVAIRAAPERASSRRMRGPDASGARFALRLSDTEPVDAVMRALPPSLNSQVVYTNEVSVGEERWTEVRIGFFATEAAAEQALAVLGERFPDAWVTAVSPAEQAAAAEQQRRPAPEPEPPPPPPATAGTGEMLPAERTAELLEQARMAMLNSDYEQGIRLYTRLVEVPSGEHRPQAREYLGVAREKNGQFAHARAEYQAYLDEFPDSADADRIRQRLAALTVPAAAASVARREPDPAGQWRWSGTVSQLYLRGVDQSRDDEPDVVSQSALLNQAVFAADRRGDRFDLSARANVGYLYDFTDEGDDEQGLVSHAYLDVNDKQLGASARLGRQTRHRSGVLGRFDGMHLSYALMPDLSVNVTAGFPVDSPRYMATTDRYFYGASADLTGILDAVDLTVFTNLQHVDGIWDRQAIGGEAQYRGERINIVGMIDYDGSFEVLNTALIMGTWRIVDRITLHGRFQGGAGPYLTTRNAIIGQPVRTVAALFDTYSEGQIRRLARNRTAEARTGAGGLTAELSERWQFNADVTYHEYGSTRTSGGVELVPTTAPQYTYSGSLVGASVVRPGDSVILSYRRFDSRDRTADTAIVDLRLPIGDALRINPRVALTRQIQDPDGSRAERLITNPMLRVLYRSRRSFRIELEVGGQLWDSELPVLADPTATSTDSIKQSVYYLQLGYWMEF